MNSIDFIKKYTKLQIQNQIVESFVLELSNFILDNRNVFIQKYDTDYLNQMNNTFYQIIESIDDYKAPYDDLTTFIKKIIGLNPDDIPPQLRDKFTKLKSYHNIRELLKNHLPIQAESIFENLQEKHMTQEQIQKKETIARALKTNIPYLKQRYGNDWKNVLYAIATKHAIKEDVLDEGFNMTSRRELMKHLKFHGWEMKSGHHSNNSNGEHDNFYYVGSSKNKPKYHISLPKHKDIASMTAKKIHDQAIPDNFSTWNIKLKLEEYLDEDENKRKGHFKITFEDGSTVIIHNAHDPEHAQQIAETIHGKKVTKVSTYQPIDESYTLSLIKEVINSKKSKEDVSDISKIKKLRKTLNSDTSEILHHGGTTLTNQKRNQIHINPKFLKKLDK